MKEGPQILEKVITISIHSQMTMSQASRLLKDAVLNSSNMVTIKANHLQFVERTKMFHKASMM